MSPNEKMVLKAIQEVGKANAVNIRNATGLPLEYADYICRALFSKGYLEIDSMKGLYKVYRLSARGKDRPLL